MGESVDLQEEAGKENEQTLANLSLAEEAASKDEVEIEKFLQEQKSKNTQYKNKSDLNAWKKFCESLKESRAIENIPANELDLLLSKFFISVRKQNGTEYERSTKTLLLQPNSMTQTRRRFLITPLERPVLDNFSKQTFSQTSLHSCTAKRSLTFENSRQLPFSISEATARNVCYPELSARYIRSVRRKPSQYLHYNTAKCLHSPTNPASGNFCRSAY